MRVAIDPRLIEIKKLLHSKNYEVYPIDTSLSTPVSAVIYMESGNSGGLLSYSGPTALTSSACLSTGTFMINAHNKTPEQVLSILEQRIYSPLF